MQIEQLFHLVGNAEYRNILLRDFEELKICLNNKAYKSTIVLSGSILEALLIEFFVNKALTENEVESIQNLNLFNLINKAKREKLISERTKNMAHALRDYRNYIHPAKEVRTKEDINQSTAIISYNLLELVLKEIHKNYDSLYGYRAEDIYSKIKSDSSTIAIFENLITKMNLDERSKLLKIMIENYFKSSYDDYEARPFLLQYFYILKPFLNNHILKQYLNSLFIEVESGKGYIVQIYFDIFGDELNLIDENKKNTILKYLHEHIRFSGNNRHNLLQYKQTNIYNHLSFYVDNENNKILLLDLINSIVRELNVSKGHEEYLEIFKILNNNLDWEEIDEYLRHNCDSYHYDFFMTSWKEYNEPIDDLPF